MMSAPADDESGRLAVYQLALEESRTALQDQLQQPEKIRRNVGALLGFAAVSVTLFSATSSVGGPWVAGFRVGVLITVLGLAVCTAVVVAPRKVVPSVDARKIVRWGDDVKALDQVIKSLAEGNEGIYSQNSKVIKKMFTWQIIATVCFGLTAVLLALQAIGS